ncbi:bifunctional phosphatase PAP2/diacylglycerol kinase family protein [Actinoalloteichus spitiensis]|uniref:bifunctional phosphatase PAP2/diacylglycerol kinase family protein n=1 Tax=Actinoalloteichus spitiensis TaxID=252394 RepID=UPI0006915117|nr:bifunctional phosphatase PAP2/diacylglycerol kinase family protein [Actinoalloteichus spitiensis]
MRKWVSEVLGRANRVDGKLVRASGRLPASRADAVFRGLGTAANHSLLWFGIAALLASREGVTRRAAYRAVVSIAGASFTANLVGKPLVPRRRPATDLISAERRYTSPPVSSSFPSGHAASAAAFVTAVGMEAPKALPVVAPLGAAVAYSRVHTGVHWPSDVVFGALLGGGVALATRRWWPLTDCGPAIRRSPVRAPALSDGAGLLVLANPGSGSGGADPAELVSEAWPLARVLSPPDDEEADLRRHVEEAVAGSAEPVRALGVAGGDGTVASVATVAAERGLPLVVVPTGTLNHFARDVAAGSPESAALATEEGSAIEVDIGTVDSDGVGCRWFVNTASLGGYPDLVRYRERWEPRWGRWLAGAAALVRVLREAEPLRVRIDGRERAVWLLFVGNGVYEPRGFAPMTRQRMDEGLLDVRYVRADLPFSRSRFLVAALTGALHHSRTYVQQERPRFEVALLDGGTRLAVDGEVAPAGRRFRFAARHRALRVYHWPERAEWRG